MAALDKKRLMREIERERKAKLRQRLAELRELIKVARVHRREAVQGVRVQCRIARQKLRTVCAKRAQEAKRRGESAIALHVKEKSDALETDRYLRQADAAHRRGVVKVRASRTERRQESDDEVRGNLPDTLRGVFERVKRHVKGSPRMSRTEAFLHWAEENPGEVYALQAEQADRDLARLIAEHQRTERQSRRKRVGNLDEVPF